MKMKTKKAVKKVNTKRLGSEEEVQIEPVKRGRGRPKKVVLETSETSETPNPVKRGRGRPKKVQTEVTQKKVAKVRKSNKASKKSSPKVVEKVKKEKVAKTARRKGGSGKAKVGGIDVVASSYTYKYNSPISAGPDVSPKGIDPKKVNTVTVKVPLMDQIQKQLVAKGFQWDEKSFKVAKKTDVYWMVCFEDKEKGPVTVFTNIQEQKDVEKAEKEAVKKSKVPNLPKVELNRYLKTLAGRDPQDVTVIENTDQYFVIEFKDGINGTLTKCAHYKGWDKVEVSE